MGGIFLQSSESFHSCQPYLIVEIKFFGITGLVNKLLESYLKNSFQRVIIGNKPRQQFSKWGPVSDGAPPGIFYFVLMISQGHFGYI